MKIKVKFSGKYGLNLEEFNNTTRTERVMQLVSSFLIVMSFIDKVYL